MGLYIARRRRKGEYGSSIQQKQQRQERPPLSCHHRPQWPVWNRVTLSFIGGLKSKLGAKHVRVRPASGSHLAARWRQYSPATTTGAASQHERFRVDFVVRKIRKLLNVTWQKTGIKPQRHQADNNNH